MKDKEAWINSLEFWINVCCRLQYGQPIDDLEPVEQGAKNLGYEQLDFIGGNSD
jgi:hypothetical protein